MCHVETNPVRAKIDFCKDFKLNSRSTFTMKVKGSHRFEVNAINHKKTYVVYPAYNKLTCPAMNQCEIQTYAHQDH